MLWSYRWRCCRWSRVSGNVRRSLDDAKHCRGLWQLRRRILLRVRCQSSDTELPADYQPAWRTEARCHTRIHADKYAYCCLVDFTSKIVVRGWLSFALLWIRKVLIHRARSRSTSVHSALAASRLCSIQIYFWHWHWQGSVTAVSVATAALEIMDADWIETHVRPLAFKTREYFLLLVTS